MWPMCLLFIKTSPVKQYSYKNDFSGVFDDLHQSFLVYFSIKNYIGTQGEDLSTVEVFYSLLRVVYAGEGRVGLGKAGLDWEGRA